MPNKKSIPYTEQISLGTKIETYIIITNSPEPYQTYAEPLSPAFPTSFTTTNPSIIMRAQTIQS